MNYEILCSSSAGNATVINGNILIDIGVGYNRIAPYEKDLKLVLTTHQHGDHFNPRTVARLAKNRPTLRWATVRHMIPFLIEAGVDKRSIDLIHPNQWYSYFGIGLIQAFLTPHNVPNCGWKIIENSNTLIYATDLGYIPDGLAAKGYDFYLIEANHREAEIEARAAAKLEAGEFSYETAAAQNHLSYEQAIEWLATQMGPRSIWVPMHEHKEKERNGDGREADDLQQDYGS